MKKLLIGRSIPPTAAPIPMRTILSALVVSFKKDNIEGIFENELAYFFGVKHCFLISSGKAALTIILNALKKKYPDRTDVVVPAITCYSVPAAIKRSGLKIKICDTAKSSLFFDSAQLNKLISGKKPLCVLVTHLYGCASNLEKIQKTVGNDIPIVEDAAQAMGVINNDKKIGTIGDVGFFSLGRGKALSTVEGGIIVTDRNDIASTISDLIEKVDCSSRFFEIKLMINAILTNIFMNPMLFWLPKALPFLSLGETIYEQDFIITKITRFQRALSKGWQRRLELHHRARMVNNSFWNDTLFMEQQPAVSCNGGRPIIKMPLLARTNTERDHLVNYSESHGLGIMPGYPTPINEIPEIASEFIHEKFHQAKGTCDRLFLIPVHELISDNDKKKIGNLLKRYKYSSLN